MSSIVHWKKIDAAWLTDMLQRNGISETVTGVTAAPVGTGQTGDCIRFELSYQSENAQGPKSLVGKFPADDEGSRHAGMVFGGYIREIKFYEILQRRAAIATPRIFAAEIDNESHDFVLIMEDLAPAQQGDQIAGVSIEQAKIGIEEAAKLHAAFWNHDEINEIPWVFNSATSTIPFSEDMFINCWPKFVERYGDKVTPNAKKLGDMMVKNWDGHQAMRAGARSLVHCDYRPDNMMFGASAQEKPICIVDWQSFAYGPPATDVGFFIAGAITSDERREYEAELLDVYKAELAKGGVDDYDDEMLHRHYVAGAYQLFRTAFTAAAMVEQTERGDEMFFKMLNGAVDLIYDNGAESWFA